MFGGAVAMQNQVIDHQDYFYVDNYYLKLMIEMGYTGLAAFVLTVLGFLANACRALYRRSRPGTRLDISFYLFAQALIIQHHALGRQNIFLRTVCPFFHFLQLGSRRLGSCTEAFIFLCRAHHHTPKARLDVAKPAHRTHRKAGGSRYPSHKFHAPGPLFRCVMYMPAGGGCILVQRFHIFAPARLL